MSNSFDPPTRGIATIRTCSETSAWSAAESHIGRKFVALTKATLSWFDPTWATSRVPGTKALHWLLEGEDENGVFRHVIVSCDPVSVVLADSDEWHFAVRQTHYGYVNNGAIYYDSDPGVTSCVEQTPVPTATCTNPAFDDELLLRPNFERTVDLWDRETQSSALWPFPNKFIATDIRAVVAHGAFNLSDMCGGAGPCAVGGVYYFPNTAAASAAGGQVSTDLVGHEYAHRVLRQYKMLFTDPVTPTKPGQFTEAMCDLFGIANEDYLLGEAGAPSRTDFQINPKHTVTTIKWPSYNSATQFCQSDPRRTMGLGFYQAALVWGLDGVAPHHDASFHAWFRDIMFSFAMTPFTGPTGKDLHAAMASRVNTCLNTPGCSLNSGTQPLKYAYWTFAKVNALYWNAICGP